MVREEEEDDDEDKDEDKDNDNDNDDDDEDDEDEDIQRRQTQQPARQYDDDDDVSPLVPMIPMIDEERRYRIVFVPGSYVGFYVLWSTRGDDGGQHVPMGPVMLTGFGQFWSDLVETWVVRGERRSGRRGMIGGRRSSLWAKHCPEPKSMTMMMT